MPLPWLYRADEECVTASLDSVRHGRHCGRFPHQCVRPRRYDTGALDLQIMRFAIRQRIPLDRRCYENDKIRQRKRQAVIPAKRIDVGLFIEIWKQKRNNIMANDDQSEADPLFEELD